MNYTPEATADQMVRAEEIRNSGRQVSKADRTALNQIVHSGDATGPSSKTTNTLKD